MLECRFRPYNLPPSSKFTPDFFSFETAKWCCCSGQSDKKASLWTIVLSYVNYLWVFITKEKIIQLHTGFPDRTQWRFAHRFLLSVFNCFTCFHGSKTLFLSSSPYSGICVKIFYCVISIVSDTAWQYLMSVLSSVCQVVLLFSQKSRGRVPKYFFWLLVYDLTIAMTRGAGSRLEGSHKNCSDVCSLVLEPHPKNSSSSQSFVLR